jgi:hypothetical protein
MIIEDTGLLFRRIKDYLNAREYLKGLKGSIKINKYFKGILTCI